MICAKSSTDHDFSSLLASIVPSHHDKSQGQLRGGYKQGQDSKHCIHSPHPAITSILLIQTKAKISVQNLEPRFLIELDKLFNQSANLFFGSPV
jgi:hypothetical protein